MRLQTSGKRERGIGKSFAGSVLAHGTTVFSQWQLNRKVRVRVSYITHRSNGPEGQVFGSEKQIVRPLSFLLFFFFALKRLCSVTSEIGPCSIR